MLEFIFGIAMQVVLGGRVHITGSTLIGSVGNSVVATTASNTQFVIDNHWTGTATIIASMTNTTSGGILQNPVNDVNASMFTGSNLCPGSSNCYTDPADATHHWFVLGTRQAQEIGGTNSKCVSNPCVSRALQNNTQHYYQIVVGGTPQTCPGGGTVCPFFTSNIASDETWNEPPDAFSDGTTIHPTIPDTRNVDFIDPKTGTQIRNLFVSTDGNIPSLYDGANKHICPPVLQTAPDGTQGWLCSLPNDAGAPQIMYYIVKNTREIRYLGLQRGAATWPTCDTASAGPLDDIDPTYMFQTVNFKTGGSGCPGTTVTVLERGHYVGDYGVTPVAPGANANIVWDLLTPNPAVSIPQLVKSFDATYDTTVFPNCGLDDIFKNGYGLFECRIGIQGSYLWYAIVFLGDRQPLGSCTDCLRVVAAYQGWSNSVSRWSGSHSGTMVSTAPLAYVVPGGFEGDTQGGTGAAPYLGPYASVLTGAINNSQTTISLSGQPKSMSDATVQPYLQDLAVGDNIIACPASTLNGAINNSTTTVVVNNGSWSTNGLRIDFPPEAGGNTEEVVTITSGGGTNTWTVTRGSAGTTPSAHSSGVNAGIFYNDCGFNQSYTEQMQVTSVAGLPSGGSGGPGTIGVARNFFGRNGPLSFASGANIITLSGQFFDGNHYLWWPFLTDPHGNNGGLKAETNIDFYGNHADFGGIASSPSTQIMVTEAYHTRVGDFVTNIDGPTTVSIHPIPQFQGVTSEPGDGNSYSRYPVADKQLAGPVGFTWFQDQSGLIGGSTPNPGAALVGGTTQIYKYIYCTVALNNCGGSEVIIHRKIFPTMTIAGTKTLTDISGPSSTIVDGSGGAWTYCVANAANECVTGSSIGDTYANVPGLTSFQCSNDEGGGGSQVDLCIIDSTAAGAALTQYTTTPTLTGLIGRKIASNTLSINGIRFVKELSKPTPDGALSFFRMTNSQMFLATMPPWISAKDSYDRSRYIPINVTLPPTGMTIPATTATALVQFGYQESNGNCTTRLEGCVSVTSGSVPNPPFSFITTDTYSRLACASSCTITVPAMSSRTVIMSAKYYNAGGTLLRTDVLQPVIAAPAGYFP